MSLIVRCGNCSRTFRVRQHPGDRQVLCQCGQPLDFSSHGGQSFVASFLPLLVWGGLATVFVIGAGGIALLLSGSTDSAGPAVASSGEQLATTVPGDDKNDRPSNRPGVGPAFTVGPISVQEVVELQEVRIPAPVSLTGVSGAAIRFSLSGEVPTGVRLDPLTGAVTWTPSEQQGPGEYTIVIKARVDSPDLEQLVKIPVKVLEANTRPSLASTVASKAFRVPTGATFVADMGGGQDRDFPRNRLKYRLTGAVPKNAKIDADTGQFLWQPPESLVGRTLPITVVVSDDGKPSLSASVQYRFRVVRGDADKKSVATSPTKSKTTVVGKKEEPRVAGAKPDADPDTADSQMRDVVQLIKQGDFAKSLELVEMVLVRKDLQLLEKQKQRMILFLASGIAQSLGEKLASGDNMAAAHIAFMESAKHFRNFQKEFPPLDAREKQLGAAVFYNEARALAAPNKTALDGRVLASLREAVRMGFADFEMMKSDKALQSIRDTKGGKQRFARLILQWKALAAKNGVKSPTGSANKTVVKKPAGGKAAPRGNPGFNFKKGSPAGPGKNQVAKKPGSKDAACGLCSGNGINGCPTQSCKNGYQKIRGTKYPCADCLGFGRIPCRTCPDLGKKRMDSLATIKTGRTYFTTMQKVASRNRVVISSVSSLQARNRRIDNEIDDEETSVSRVRELTREKVSNEVQIIKLKGELPALQKLFSQAKSGVARSVRSQASLLSDGQSAGFQFSIKNRLRDLLKVISGL
ncbi:MAG TPA: hypothetical protein DCE47_11355 [Planctomycetaceae bacterium]|nr:hypothetical protein [Planctomycetaceae bacterium]